MVLQKAHKADYGYIKELYRKSFPIYERMPFSFMRRKCEKGKMEILLVRTDSGPSALAVPTCYKDTVLLNYFAVDESCRGHGIGSQVIALLAERYSGKRLIVEIEKPDTKKPDTVRRKAFYQRNGFEDAGIDIILAGTPMEVLTLGGRVSAQEYLDIYLDSFGPTLVKMAVKIVKQHGG